MLLTSFFVGSMLTTFGSTEFTKTQHFSLEKDTKEKILNEGLYHFTSQENANRIAKEGYFLPSKGIFNNHFGKEKVYMFGGLPDVDDFSKNLPYDMNPFLSGNLEFFAVKVQPNALELSKFKERLQDNAIVYEGRYELPSNRTKVENIVLDLDEKGNYFFREKTFEEYELGYSAKEELLQKLEQDRKGLLALNLESIKIEVEKGFSSLPKVYQKLKNEWEIKYNKYKQTKENDFTNFSTSYHSRGKNYVTDITSDEIVWMGDKKLNKVKVKRNCLENPEENTEEFFFMDGDMLNLGANVANEYIQQILDLNNSEYIKKIDDIPYVGQPVMTGDKHIGIGMDTAFLEYLKELQTKEQTSKINYHKYEEIKRQAMLYKFKHPLAYLKGKLSSVMNKTKMLEESEFGRYVNEKLEHFSYQDSSEIEGENKLKSGFCINGQYNFKYQNGNEYQVVLGDIITIEDKVLRKVIVGEKNILEEKYQATQELPKNYYIEDIDFTKIKKEDLAKYFSSLRYVTKEEEMLNIDTEEFCGSYVGGIEVSKSGKIKKKTYSKELEKRYLVSKEVQQENRLDLSSNVYTQEEYVQMRIQCSDISEAKQEKEEDNRDFPEDGFIV